MKTAIYPGSFNPWHKGHQDILDKALQVFDRVLVASFKNDDDGKKTLCEITVIDKDGVKKPLNNDGYNYYKKTLPEILYNRRLGPFNVSAVIRGLRNGNDLQYEQNLLYTYEDLGLEIPIFYILCDRTKSHISSSMIRGLKDVGINYE